MIEEKQENGMEDEDNIDDLKADIDDEEKGDISNDSDEDESNASKQYITV